MFQYSTASWFTMLIPLSFVHFPAHCGWPSLWRTGGTPQPGQGQHMASNTIGSKMVGNPAISKQKKVEKTTFINFCQFVPEKKIGNSNKPRVVCGNEAHARYILGLLDFRVNILEEWAPNLYILCTCVWLPSPLYCSFWLGRTVLSLLDSGG